MNDEPPKAWQPLTFGGVARYAGDSVGMLFVTCAVVSILVAAAVVWTARRAWAPVITQAISRLPPGAELRGGSMKTPQVVRLAENAFLAITLDPTGASAPPATADLQLTLAARDFRFRSLFGTMAFPYRPEWTLPLNRAEMEPWWGAWRPAVLSYLAVGTLVFLFVSWVSLAAFYTPVALLIAGAANRKVSLWGAWKLSVAALMPGAFFLTAAILFYGLGTLRVPEMIGAFALHFLIGWFFLAGGAFWLPRKAANPFKKPSDKANDEDSPLEPHDRDAD